MSPNNRDYLLKRNSSKSSKAGGGISLISNLIKTRCQEIIESKKVVEDISKDDEAITLQK